jgi:hypothetical protein
MKRRRGNTGVILGAVVLASAVLLFGAVLVRAMGYTPVASAVATEAEAAPSEVVSAPPSAAEAPVIAEAIEPEATPLPRDVLARAVERAPFDPNREAPTQHYLLPDERVVPAPPPPRVELPAPPAFKVLGTISGPDGNVAVMSVEDGPPMIMALGQEMNGYRLSNIGDARVTMTGQGRTVSLQLADAQPNAARNARNAQNGRAAANGRNQNTNTNNRNQPAGAAAAAEAARALLERAGAAGGRVQINGGQATITLPDGTSRQIQMPTGLPGGQDMFFNFDVGGVQVRPPAGGGRGGGGGGGF